MDTFRTVVPYIDSKDGDTNFNSGDAVHRTDGATDGVTEILLEKEFEYATKGLQKKLVILIKAIASNEGKRIPDYMGVVGLGGERTVERLIHQLRKANIIEFKGDASKTGGYYLTKKARKKLGQQK